MNKMNNNFRTKLNKTLEEHLSQFEYWDEIQTKKVDLAFEAYLTGSYIPKLAPRDVEKVFELIGQGGILGVAVEAHEKWECLEYLKEGYSIAQIGDGTAHKAHHSNGEWFDVHPHAEARFKEHKLYQFLYKKLFKEKPPALVSFLLVTPYSEIFNFENIDIEKNLNYYMNHFMHEYGKHEETVMAEKCSEKDLEKALMFFEKSCGYEYKDRQKALRMAKEYLKNGLKNL